jgi:hypothetical protein
VQPAGHAADAAAAACHNALDYPMLINHVEAVLFSAARRSMRLLVRIIAVVAALGLVGSSTLSAMPLVWCIGNDGHRAVETILHQHAPQAADAAAEEDEADPSHKGPCSDWQLMSAAGAPQEKGQAEAPKQLAAVIAYPPLELVVARSWPARGAAWAGPRFPMRQAHLLALRSVVLLI